MTNSDVVQFGRGNNRVKHLARFFMAVLVGCTSYAAPTELAQRNLAFGLDLYTQVKGNGNVFFSPYSVSTALAMTYAGARGATQKEMARVLHFNAAPRKFMRTSPSSPGESNRLGNRTRSP